jgi:squalene monooxygenase
MLENIAPELPPKVEECFRKSIETERIRVMPNSRLPGKTSSNFNDGVFLLGDALNMRHPLTGSKYDKH